MHDAANVACCMIPLLFAANAAGCMQHTINLFFLNTKIATVVIFSTVFGLF
jgi:uncharacterized membrane protein